MDAAEYGAIRQEFMQSLSSQEEGLDSALSIRICDDKPSPLHLSDIMNRSWETGAFWYTLALASPSGIFSIFNKHVRPLFCKSYEEEFETIMPFFFEKEVGCIAGRKLADRVDYNNTLRQGLEST